MDGILGRRGGGPRSLRTAGGALVVLLLLSPYVVGQDAVEALAVLTYDQGGALAGDAQIEMSAAAIAFPGGPPPELVVQSEQARVFVVETTWNHTVLVHQYGQRDPGFPTQKSYWLDLAPGALRVHWPHGDAEDRILIRAPTFFDDDAGPLEFNLTTDRGSWGPVTIGTDGYGYWWPAPGGPGYAYGTIGTWHRQFTPGDGPAFPVSSGAVFQVQGAAIDLPGGATLDLGPFQKNTEEGGDPTGTVRRVSATLTHAFVFIERGTFWLPGTGLEISATNFRAAIEGDATFAGATGRYTIGGVSGSLTQETVTTSGNFVLEDEVPDYGGTTMGERRSATMTASGDLAVLAIDFTVRAIAAPSPSLLQQALWVTLALAVLSAMVWLSKQGLLALYSRLSEDAVLAHPRRAEIMEFIKQNPACHVLGLSSQLGMARGVTRHHLLVLERAGKVRRFYEEGQTVLVPAGHPRTQALRALAEDDSRIASIRELVRKGPVRRNEVVATLRGRYGIADPTARRWVQKAVRLGVIVEEGSGHSVTYRVNE